MLRNIDHPGIRIRCFGHHFVFGETKKHPKLPQFQLSVLTENATCVVVSVKDKFDSLFLKTFCHLKKGPEPFPKRNNRSCSVVGYFDHIGVRLVDVFKTPLHANVGHLHRCSFSKVNFVGSKTGLVFSLFGKDAQLSHFIHRNKMSVDFTKPSVKRYFGKNLLLAQQNYNREIERAKSEFRSKYPNAILSHFEFWNWPNPDGTVTEPTEIVYKGVGGTKLYNETGTMWKYSWPVDSPTFQNKYRSNLFFGPSEIWQTQGKQQPFALGQSALPFDLNTFKIYISNVKGFKANFDVLDTKWRNEAEDSSILHADILKYNEDPYLTALVVCYVITVKSGVCMKHFKNDNKVPKITTSILRYYLYYNMARFLHDPSKLKNYITTGELALIQKHIPIKRYGSKNINKQRKQSPYFLLKKEKRGRR